YRRKEHFILPIQVSTARVDVSTAKRDGVDSGSTEYGGDENPICTLGDYSKPSHEGYMNTIELLIENNVVPLRSDTIRLVQNGCSFYGLRYDDPNQHLKDFLKLVDSLDLDAGGRLRKLRPDETWATIERLAQYEDEGWNDAFIPVKMSLNYENPDIEQLLGIMKRKVDTLTKDAISLMRRSKSIFRMTTNKMYRPPSKPSRDENPICTLEDYSKPSHEGYMNTIELLVENNVVPLRSDTIRLVQNGCSFYGLRYDDPNQHLKDFLKLMDSLDLDVQIFYDHIDCTTQIGIDYAAGGRLRKLRPDETWATIERLAQYEDEGWNDAFIPSIDPPPHVFKKNSLITMGVLIELQNEIYVWLVLRAVEEEKEANEEAEGDMGHKGVGGSAEIYPQHDPGRLASSPSALDGSSIDPPPHVFKKHSLITIGVLIELQNEICVWLALRAVEEEKEANEEAEGDVGHKGVGGSAEIYPNMTQGDWQVRQVRWMDQLYLMRRSLEVLRMFHWIILGGRFNQLSHVSSPLLSKPGESPFLNIGIGIKLYESADSILSSRTCFCNASRDRIVKDLLDKRHKD
nr:MAK10-like protein [Tanacetum cinerariifolium]